MKKKTPKQLLAAQKKWWKAEVRKNWGNKCAKCGREGCKLDTHHLYYGKELRWYEPVVGILLCSNCHKLGLQSAHKGGFLFYSWLFHEHPDITRKLIELIGDK